MDNNNGVVIGVVALIVIFLAVVGLAIFKKHDDQQLQQPPAMMAPGAVPPGATPPPPGQPAPPPNINIEVNPNLHDARFMYQMGWNDAYHRRAPVYRNNPDYMRGYADCCRVHPGNPHFRIGLEIR